jgi:hypothetical protein
MTGVAWRWLVAVSGGLALSVAQAQDPREAGEAPDLDFLEYLGTWQASDEEWLALSAWDGRPPEEERDRQNTDTDEVRDEKD